MFFNNMVFWFPIFVFFLILIFRPKRVIGSLRLPCQVLDPLSDCEEGIHLVGTSQHEPQNPKTPKPQNPNPLITLIINKEIIVAYVLCD